MISMGEVNMTTGREMNPGPSSFFTREGGNG